MAFQTSESQQHFVVGRQAAGQGRCGRPRQRSSERGDPPSRRRRGLSGELGASSGRPTCGRAVECRCYLGLTPAGLLHAHPCPGEVRGDPPAWRWGRETPLGGGGGAAAFPSLSDCRCLAGQWARRLSQLLGLPGQEGPGPGTSEPGAGRQPLGRGEVRVHWKPCRELSLSHCACLRAEPRRSPRTLRVLTAGTPASWAAGVGNRRPAGSLGPHGCSVPLAPRKQL